MKNAFVSLCLCGLLFLPACGARTRAQKEALARHERWQTANLQSLKEATPPEDPLYPGIVTISDAQKIFYESLTPYLPPREKMDPAKELPVAPFKEAAAASKQAQESFLAAVKIAEDLKKDLAALWAESRRLGREAADKLVWESSTKTLAPVLAAHQDAAQKAFAPPESTGFFTSLLNGIGAVAGWFGPVGAALSGALGLIVAGLKWFEAKKMKTRVTALVLGIERGVQAGQKEGWFSPAAKTNFYGCLAQAQNLIADGAAFAKEIQTQKNALRKTG